MRSRTYLGTRFEIWSGERTWFWLVPDPFRDAGAIGTAASEAEAVDEARELIEDTLVGWPGILERLARYLSSSTRATA